MRCVRDERRRRHLAKALMAATAAVLLHAAPVRGESLEEALDKAREFSPKLRADQARQDSTFHQMWSSRLSLLPTVSVTGAYALRGSVNYEPLHSRDPIPSQVGVTLSQPLFDGFKRWNDIGRTTAANRAGAFTLADTEQQVRLDTGAAYLSVYRDQHVVELRRRSAGHLAELAASARARFAAGDATRTDIAQAEGRLEQALAELNRARGELDASCSEFEKLLGYKAPPLPRPVIADGMIPRTEEEAAERAEIANPKLAAAHFSAVAASHAAKAALGDLAPKVDLLASRFAQFQYSSAIDRRDEYAVKLQVSVPLVSADLIPRAQEAGAVARQRHYEAVDARLGVKAAARAAFARRAAGIRRVAALSRQIDATQSALVGVRKEFLGGQRTLLDILNAQAELVNAQVARQIAEYDRDFGTLQLLAATGQLMGNRVMAAR